MNIFDFQISGKLQETNRLDDLDIISQLVRFPLEIQMILQGLAINGSVKLQQMGVKKGMEILTSLSQSPFVVHNDFDLLGEPLFKRVYEVDGAVNIEASESDFFPSLRKVIEKFKLEDHVSFKQDGTCRFYSNWVIKGKPRSLKLVFSGLCDVLGVDKRNYKSYANYKRMLETIQKEFESNSLMLEFERDYHDGKNTRAKGVVFTF